MKLNNELQQKLKSNDELQRKLKKWAIDIRKLRIQRKKIKEEYVQWLDKPKKDFMGRQQKLETVRKQKRKLVESLQECVKKWIGGANARMAKLNACKPPENYKSICAE